MHVRWLRLYARGARRAAQLQSGAQRAQSEEMADRLLAAAAALTTETEIRLADYARAEEVAERLGIHVESARRLMRSGKLPAERVRGRWLVGREALEAFARGYAWGDTARAREEMELLPVHGKRFRRGRCGGGGRCGR